MEENTLSRTALFTAYFRGYHAKFDAPPIFDDHLAWDLLTEERCGEMGGKLAQAIGQFAPERAALFTDQTTALSEVIHRYTSASLMLCRARYTEDRLEEAIRNGIGQYVILGAGLDTFAFRRRDLLERLEVFELDHPATQDFKRRRLDALHWDIPPRLHLVSVDFTMENIASSLARSPYDPAIPAFFSWLGVTYYLPRDTVFATWRTIADLAATGSRLAFDYDHPDIFDPQKTSRHLQMGLAYVRSIGEPLLTTFDPLALGGYLEECGLRLDENLGPADIETRYFLGRTDGYHAPEMAYLAQAVTV